MRFDPRQSVSDSEGAVALKPRVSRGAVLLVLVMAVLATFSVGLSGLALSLQMPLLVVVLVLAWTSLRRLIQRVPHRIVLNEQGLVIHGARGESVRVIAFKGVFLSPWYLGFCGVDEIGRVILRTGYFRDQFERESYRQLSAWFRERPK